MGVTSKFLNTFFYKRFEYHVSKTCEGENFRKFCGFVMIGESFFRGIWGRSILWCCRNEQSVKVFSAKITFFTDPRNFSPSKVFRYTASYD